MNIVNILKLLMVFLFSDGRADSVPRAAVPRWWSQYLLPFLSGTVAAAQSRLLQCRRQSEGGVVSQQPGNHAGNVTHVLCVLCESTLCELSRV